MLSHYWVATSASANWPQERCRYCDAPRGAEGVGFFCAGPMDRFQYVRKASRLDQTPVQEEK